MVQNCQYTLSRFIHSKIYSNFFILIKIAIDNKPRIHHLNHLVINVAYCNDNLINICNKLIPAANNLQHLTIHMVDCVDPNEYSSFLYSLFHFQIQQLLSITWHILLNDNSKQLFDYLTKAIKLKVLKITISSNQSTFFTCQCKIDFPSLELLNISGDSYNNISSISTIKSWTMPRLKAAIFHSVEIKKPVSNRH